MDGEHIRHRQVSLVLALTGMLYGLLVSVLAPALPALASSLDADLAATNWLFIGFLLSSAVTTPILGRLGDVVGKKKMLVLVLGVVAVGILVSALARSLAVMVIGRVIQGALGGALPLSFGMIRDEFPKERVAAAIGIISGFVGVGTGLGLSVAGPLVDHLSYHWLYWMPLALIVLTLAAVAIVVPDAPARGTAGINWLGATFMSGWLVALLLGVSEGPSRGWRDPAVVGLFVGTPFLLALWVVSELRSRHPLVDMPMMRIPTVWTTNLVSFVLGNGLFAIAIIIPAFAGTPERAGYGFGASAAAVGLFLMPVPIGTLIFSVHSGPLTARYGSKPLLVIATFLITCAYASLAIFHDHRWNLYLASSLVGIGSGLSFTAMPNLVVSAVPPTHSGVAAGMNGNIRLLGQVLGSGMVTSVLASSAVANGFPSESGYTLASLACAATLVVGLVAALAVPGRDGARARIGWAVTPMTDEPAAP